jgi:RNA polymerase sigma-70 factor (ECF subfamily)
MAHESAFESLPGFLAEHARLVEGLHAEAGCARWQVSRECFAEFLRRSVEKRFRGVRASAAEVEAYLKALHLEDLALACACSAGIEPAWEFFVSRYRPELRAAARAILGAAGARDETRAEELADSLYADLYGIGPTGSVRSKSLFEYFHGRSKLSTWLRSVLAQRHVDALRTGQRTVSLDAEEGESPDKFKPRADPAPSDPERARYLEQLDAALTEALAGLAPRDRMVLAFYYLDQLTLAEIGRTLGEHESTVSRQLERTRRLLRERVTEFLRRGTPAPDGHPREPGLGPAEIELAFEYALEDWPFDLSSAMARGGPGANPPKG